MLMKDPPVQVAVGDGSLAAHDGGLFAAALGHVGIDKDGGRIQPLRNGRFRHGHLLLR